MELSGGSSRLMIYKYLRFDSVATKYDLYVRFVYAKITGVIVRWCRSEKLQ